MASIPLKAFWPLSPPGALTDTATAITATAAFLAEDATAATYKHNKSVSALALTATAITATAAFLAEDATAATYKHNKSVSTLALTATAITTTAAFLAEDATAATYKHNKSVSTLALTSQNHHSYSCKRCYIHHLYTQNQSQPCTKNATNQEMMCKK